MVQLIVFQRSDNAPVAETEVAASALADKCQSNNAATAWVRAFHAIGSFECARIPIGPYVDCKQMIVGVCFSWIWIPMDVYYSKYDISLKLKVS